MLLVGVREKNGWLMSRWQLTYGAGWEHICNAVYTAYDYFVNTEILVNDELETLVEKDEIFDLIEAGKMTLRGQSVMINVPMMITFYNQTNIVDVNVPCDQDEFQKPDYRSFNKSLCQFMDSLELAMYI